MIGSWRRTLPTSPGGEVGRVGLKKVNKGVRLGAAFAAQQPSRKNAHSKCAGRNRCD